MLKSSHRKKLVLAVILYFPLLAYPAQLEEVIVTATKRESGLMDAPMSVLAFTGDEMRDNGIRDFQDLALTIPNVTISEGRAGIPTVNIRGVQAGEDNGFESSVGIFVDGVYFPRPQAAFSPFFDVASVEVLKGPQAVLYGLNSTAGVVNVHSRSNNPGDALEGEVVGNYEFEHDGNSVFASIGGGLGEALGVRLAIRSFDDGDGFLENVFTGEDTVSTNGTEARFSMVWQPADTITSVFKYSYADIDSEGANQQQLKSGLGEDKLNWKLEADVNGSPESAVMNVVEGASKDNGEKKVDALAWETDFGIGGSVLSLILGYNNTNLSHGYDLDASATPTPPIFVFRTEKQEQRSVELQFTSPAEEKFEYIVGLYYSDATTELSTSSALDLTSLGIPGGIEEYSRLELKTDTEVLSGYGNLTLNVNETLRVTAGLRYTDESKDYVRDPNGQNCQWYSREGAVHLGPALVDVFCAATSRYSDDRSSGNIMPELIGQWDVSDNTMVYAKASTATKSGGFTTAVGADTLSYDDETATGFELGAKTSFADGAGRMSVALFRTEFDDLQVNSFDEQTASAFITNVGEATSQGAEIDLTYAATDAITLGVALAYLDAEYDKFDGSACPVHISEEERAVRCDGLGGTQDSAGQSLQHAPTWSGNAYASWDYPISNGIHLVGRLNISGTDDYLTDIRDDPYFKQKGYALFDAQIGFTDNEGRWRVALIGSNLTEKAVQDGGTTFLSYNIVSVNRPRTITLQAQYRFGS